MNVQAGSARRPFNNTGVYGDEVPPVLIPNTEVKLISADGTWLDTARESMTMPVPKRKSTQQCVLFLFARIGPCPAPTRERLSGAHLYLHYIFFEDGIYAPAFALTHSKCFLDTTGAYSKREPQQAARM